MTSSAADCISSSDVTSTSSMASSPAAAATPIVIMSSLAGGERGLDGGLNALTRPSVHPLSIGYVTAALVLGIMCLVLGLVYGYIHFTRVNRGLHGRSRFAFDLRGGFFSGDAHAGGATHIFLVRNAAKSSMQTL